MSPTELIKIRNALAGALTSWRTHDASIPIATAASVAYTRVWPSWSRFSDHL
jgi:hypothetical protein